jgi:(p)ppGpp synthase/HD superfamily hydrolase
VDVRYAQTHLALYARLQERGAGEEALGAVASSYELALRLFSNRVRPCGRPFVTHLVGTASVVAEHEGDLDSILAAMLHAAYAQGEFGDAARGAAPAHRARVRDVVGPRAERLIHAYDAAAWPPSDLSAAVERVSRIGPDDLERSVLLVRLANEIDDCRDLAPCIAGSDRATMAREGLVAGVAIAEALGEEALAEVMRGLHASLDSAALPPGVIANRDRSFVVEPVRIRERLRRAVRDRVPGGLSNR